MKTLLTSLLVIVTFTLYAQFSGYYDPANWTQVNSSGCDNGYVLTGGAPGSIALWGSDNSGCSTSSQVTRYVIASEACGTISFDWDYTTYDCDGSSFDRFGYMLNGTPTQLSVNGHPFGSSQSGSTSVAVAVGDVFAFYMNATDNFCGRGLSVISNFSGPACDLVLSVDSPPTLYYGYAPLSCTNISATATSSNGPVTITGTGVVCASGPDCITVTVTATDEACCEVSVTVVVPVVDASCSGGNGNGNPKVEICHNGNTICVSPSAVPAHLAHGDHLGACGEAPDCGEESSMQALTSSDDPIASNKESQIQPRTSLIIPSLDAFKDMENTQTAFKYVDINPNPAENVVNLTVKRGVEGPTVVSIYNHSGQLVLTSKIDITVGTPVQLNTGDLTNGNYTVQLISQDGRTMSEKMIVQRRN